MSTTYSFKDLSGAFTHPLIAIPYVFTGQIGLGQVVVHMATEKTVVDTAADGSVQLSAVPGDSGTIAIECQQTSALNSFLLTWAYLVKTALNNGDVSNWAAAGILLRNTVDGSSHVASYVAPLNIPDKTYAAQGGKITWTMVCGDIQSTPGVQ
jgi:hypothetical protein